MAKHPCECCGHRTLDDPPGGTYQICPVCFWEDAPFAEDPSCQISSNGVTLREAQRNYSKFAAAAEDFKNNVRPPHDYELRDPDWLDLDTLTVISRDALLAEIEKVFRGVNRDGGVSLHETEGIDQHHSEKGLAPLRAKDTDQCWQDIRHEDLAEVCGIGGIAFFDPIGWRYHLPAYMTWYLQGGEHSDSVAASNLIYSLTPSEGKWNHLRSKDIERYESLNTAQSVAVASFLRHVLRYGEDEFDKQYMAKAIDIYWHQFV
ncbi:MAG: DUF6714 family protein [Planctomycetota bacterium]